MIELFLIIFVLLAVVCGHIVFYLPRYLSTEGSESRPVSIIIPARNEEENLPILLDSIKKQNILTETIVVNDRSTDRTLEVIKNYDVKVINLQDNPWNGKSFVCFSGVEHASHETLLFLDADTTLIDANAIAHMLDSYKKQNSRGILSIQPFHQTKKAYEKLSTVFNLMTVMGVNMFSYIKKFRQTSTVFGPALLTNISDYELTGGHRKAKDRIIEGEGLFDAYNAHSLPVQLYLGKNGVHMQMYPDGIQDVIRGWSKHIASGSDNTHPLHMIMIILFLGGAFVPVSMFVLASFIDINILFCVIAYVVYGLNFFVFSSRVISNNYLDIFMYPIYVFFFFCIYGLSWYQTNINKTVTWKGRKIKIKNKENHD